jgi:hypothetical protein
MLMQLYWLFFGALAYAQNCDNYGSLNGSTCSCPTGFGGSDCSQPACGGNIFQGSQRPLAALSGGVANLTAAGCSCEGGWSGTGCNVCQTPNACQAGNSGTTNTPAADDGLNRTLACNTTPRVWSTSQMSCRVDVCVSYP